MADDQVALGPGLGRFGRERRWRIEATPSTPSVVRAPARGRVDELAHHRSLSLAPRSAGPASGSRHQRLIVGGAVEDQHDVGLDDVLQSRGLAGRGTRTRSSASPSRSARTKSTEVADGLRQLARPAPCDVEHGHRSGATWRRRRPRRWACRVRRPPARRPRASATAAKAAATELTAGRARTWWPAGCAARCRGSRGRRWRPPARPGRAGARGSSSAGVSAPSTTWRSMPAGSGG